MIRRRLEALANARLWVLRLLFGITAFLVGFGIVGVIFVLAYDPNTDAEMVVHNGTSDVVRVRWDLNQPVAVQEGEEARFEGDVAQHVVTLSAVGDHNLTVEYSFNALSWGSELNISLSSPLSDAGYIP